LGAVLDYAVDYAVEDGGDEEGVEEDYVEGVEEVVDVEFDVVDGFVCFEEFGGVGCYRKKHNQRHTDPKRAIQIGAFPLSTKHIPQKVIRHMSKLHTAHQPFLNIRRIHIKILL